VWNISITNISSERAIGHNIKYSEHTHTKYHNKAFIINAEEKNFGSFQWNYSKYSLNDILKKKKKNFCQI